VSIKKVRDISLKWKLLIPFLFLSFVGTASLILLGVNNQKRLIESQEKKQLVDYFQAFLDQIEDRERSALSLAHQVAQSKAVQQAFARRDRSALVDLLLPSYLVLKNEFDVKQFHFHIEPATSFLRLHQIYRSGDEMASFRHTITRVEESERGLAGLERGVTGFGVRGVVPVYHQGSFIGTFEIGYSVERPFLESLSRRYNMDIALIVPKEEETSFDYLASSTAKMTLPPIYLCSEVFHAQDPKMLISSPEAPGQAIFLGPLKDFSGNSIGVVEISVDRAATLAKLAGNTDVMFAVMVVALVLSSIIIVWVVTIFLRPVHHIVTVAQKIAAGERVRRIHVEVRDEIGTLAESLNEMLEALNRAKGEIQEYCATLEERVKERTQELVEEKEKYETLVERAPLIVYRIEEDGTTVYVNQRVEDILGYSPAEVIADKDFWTRTAHHWDRQTVARELSACLAKSREFMIRYCGIHKNGQEVFLLNHAVPMVDKQGRLLAVDGIIIDVSEGKRLQEQIIQTEELKTLSNISASLAHEIRNPLTSAGGFARRLLQEMQQNDPQRKKVEIIVQEVGRLEQILKMILSYLQPVVLEFSEVDLNNLLAEAVRNSEEKFSRHEVQVEFDSDPALPTVRADRGHLRHALEVLLQNACNHMPKQSQLRITTGWNGAVVVKLSYPALHLAGDDMDHFFYPFIGGELGEGDLEVPMTKVVIHKNGGIIDIERNDQNLIVITITFAPLAQEPEREIHNRSNTVH